MIRKISRIKIIVMILLASLSCKSTTETGITTKKDVFREMAAKLATVDAMLRKKTVAVLGFEMLGRKDDSYSKYATEKLTHELVNTGRLKVIERSLIDRVLEEQRFSQSGAVDAGMAAKIGKILAVEGVVIGTINVTEDEVELMARIVESETAVILKSADMSYRVELPVKTQVTAAVSQDTGAAATGDDRSKYASDTSSAYAGGSITLARFVFSKGESVKVDYTGLPGSQYDWITLVEESAPEDSYGEWFYTYGKKSGSYTFKNVQPGTYEVRLYYDWPSGGYQVQGRIKITVK